MLLSLRLPAELISLKGRNYGNYFLFKTNHFDVRLDSISATFTGGISAHPPAGAANLSPELSLEALVALAKPAVASCKGCKNPAAASSSLRPAPHPVSRRTSPNQT